MNVKLKVCGMSDPANIEGIGALHPDYLGFIFYPKSKRFVGRDFSIPKTLPGDIKRVGVFVNEMPEVVMNLVSVHRLDYVQLHGDETPEECKNFKENGIGVIKTFSIDRSFDFALTQRYRHGVDFFLFDTKSDGYGGSGRAFDWNQLDKYDQQAPFFLSGGLSSANIQNVKTLSGMNIQAIDVNSGVEDAPGLKSIAKVKSIKDILTSKFQSKF